MQAAFLLVVLLLAIDDLQAAEGIALNDTGVDWCGSDKAIRLDCPQDGFPGQDAEAGRDALARAGKLAKVGAGRAGFDFTKVDKGGNSLPLNAKEWHCVRDNHTGLEWEVKRDDGGLHDKDHRYTWHNPERTINGGHPGTPGGGSCQGSACDTHAFTKAVNAKGLCGGKDWRVPTLIELQSIVDYSSRLPAIDTAFFPNTPVVPFTKREPSVEFWALESWPQFPENAWSIDFRAGLVAYRLKRSTSHQVRLVRSVR